MNNPMNRKLFKPRTARNKLNQMGGIMASDAELMQTVARYNMGGPVGFNLGGSTDLDNLRLDQRQLRIPQNQAFIEAMDNRAAGQNTRGVNLPRATGISNVLKAVPRAALPAAVLAELGDTALNTSVNREGIMATTPKFAGAEGQNRRPGITREQFDAMSPEDRQGYFQTEQDRLKAISTLGGIAEEVAIIPDMAQNIYEGIAGSDVVQRSLKAAGILSPTSQFERTGPRDFEERAVRTKAMNRPFESIDEFRASLPSEEGPLPAGRVVEPTAEYLQQLEQATGLPPGSIQLPQAEEADQPVPDMPDVMPKSEAEARDERRRSAEEAAATESAGQTMPDFDEGDLAEARATMPTDGVGRDSGAAGPAAMDKLLADKRGDNGVEAQITAVVTEGTQEEQQDQLKTLMAEFTNAAPKYEGMNRGLAIAKIGFAMAAGQSPNAISNIASALEQGADMFIKDKAEKDAFKRQVNLSALQYGLGEISKLKAQSRTDARTFRAVVPRTDGVMTLSDGTKIPYKANETVNVPMTEIVARNGQLPEGLSGQDKDVFLANEAAILDRKKAFVDSLKDVREELIIDDKRQLEITKNYGKNVDSFIQAEVGGKFIEEALLNISENGNYILGLPGAASATFNDFANALGIDPGKKFESKAQLQKSVGLGFQSLIKSYFTQSQSANSISNFDVTSLADAFIDAAFVQDAQGNFNLVTKDEDVLVGSLQEVLKQFARDQQAAMSSIQTYERMLQGRILPGQGTLKNPFSEGTAEQALVPLRERLNPFLGEQDQRLPEFQGERSTKFLVPVEVEETGGMKRFKIPGLS